MQTFPVKIITLIEMVIFIVVRTKSGLFFFLLATQYALSLSQRDKDRKPVVTILLFKTCGSFNSTPVTSTTILYDSISILAVWRWSMSIYSSKVNQQLQEGTTQISRGSCQQQQEKHSTKHKVLLSETCFSTGKSLV